MKLRKRTVQRIVFFLFPDVILSVLLMFFLVSLNPSRYIFYFAIIVIILLFGRAIGYFIVSWNFYANRVRYLSKILNNFKKGKFVMNKEQIKGDDELNNIYQELCILGKHLDSIFSSQREEIDKFNEVYNSIIFSISSYFVVLDVDEKVVFATEGFCNKFQFQQNEVIGKRIDEIFYFVNARLKGGVSQVRKTGVSIILEKTHLLSINKVSIIADIKVSNISVHGRSEIILIIDDVTSKLRKDYQISLMNQISESIQRDAEIERVLYSILTGVTSGSGLGFNRAMLFLVNSDDLVGKMAVGPDSFEEAIDIWSSTPSEYNHYGDKIPGERLLKKVLNASFSLKISNIFIQSLVDKANMHITDSWNDDTVSNDIREFMDVKEFVVVPLIVGNKSIGIIVADNKFNQSPIGNDAIELLSIFASQAALSIESYDRLGAVRDEMEKIRNKQDAIVESEKMAAVGRIAAHIAHEIRNPLVTMGGYARRIAQVMKDPSKKDETKNAEKVIKAANIIQMESERLEGTLSNVMDFTKPAKYIREFNNINDVIIDTVELLRNLLQERKIDVHLELNDKLPLVKSDFNQMKQVVLNLIQNAMDATHSEGIIRIYTEANDNVVTIRIIDSGTGIDEVDPNVIFEPFFTTKVTGVGLGLAIVKKIIKDHNGEIVVTNRDVGVEFEITLPIPG